MKHANPDYPTPNKSCCSDLALWQIKRLPLSMLNENRLNAYEAPPELDKVLQVFEVFDSRSPSGCDGF